jgi:hypothetical protein
VAWFTLRATLTPGASNVKRFCAVPTRVDTVRVDTGDFPCESPPTTHVRDELVVHAVV